MERVRYFTKVLAWPRDISCLCPKPTAIPVPADILEVAIPYGFKSGFSNWTVSPTYSIAKGIFWSRTGTQYLECFLPLAGGSFLEVLLLLPSCPA